MAVIFAFSFGIFYVTLFKLDPMGEQRIWAFLCLFLSLVVMVWAFLSFVFFFGAELIVGRKLGQRAFLVSLRRGFFVSLFLGCCLGLQYFRFLGVLEVTLLAIFFVLLEWVFMTAKIEPL